MDWVVDGNLAMPEIYYGHNIIPTSEGYQAVAYRTLVNAPTDTDTLFTDALILRDSSGNKAYLCATSSGRNYILKDYLSGWVRTTDVAHAAVGDLVTTAYVNGVTYIYYQGVGCYVYNFTTNTLVLTALTGLVAGDIYGLVGADGFLLAFSADQLVWSSTITPTDFTPSVITGSGGGSVQDLRGIITTVLAYKYGFIIYSQYNIVVGLYTGNIRYPFSFKEIVGSGGVSDPRYVCVDPVSGDHYAWTTSGLQLVTSTVTNAVFPALTDFIAGSYFEDFSESTKTFTQTHLSAPMVKKLTAIADRYVVFSYGISSLTHAIVYDTALKRMGKLKIPHVDCFEYLLLSGSPVDSPRNAVGFLQADGTVKVASFSINAQYSSGVILLGKFQVTRGNTCTLVDVSLENVRADSNFSCDDIYTLDGKDVAGITPGYLAQSSNFFRQYTFRQPGLNHTLAFIGGFNMVSLVLKVTQGGFR